MGTQEVAVITGAGSGIGRGLARVADQRGMQTVIVDVDEAGLSETAAQLGSEPLMLPADVTDENSVEAVAEQTFSRFGRVDLLFNNAGIMRGGLSWEVALDEWRRMLDVNIMGVVNCLNKFVPRMIAQDCPCRIVNTSSIGGFLSSPFISPYTATKFAVVALTEALAIELKLKKSKVAVSCLSPGSVKTNIFSDTRTSDFGGQVQRTVDAISSHMNDTGEDPDSFARWVFDGIDADEFWLISQAEIYRPAIMARAERIVGGVNPELEQYPMALAGGGEQA